MQMLGRAGRNGCSARGHLLYTSRQMENTKDVSLKLFSVSGSKENCHRREMLTVLGSNE